MMTRHVGFCEQILSDAEQLLAIRITLHDIGGLFHDPEGLPLLDARRQSHRRFNLCNAGFGERCLRHCGDAVCRQAARAPGPFEHTCWKGLREIAVPIKRDGILLAVLFAGFWRAPGRKHLRIAGPLNKTLAQEEQRLPQWDQNRAAKLRGVLAMLGQGLIAEVERLFKLDEQPHTRKATILRFLKYNACRPIGLHDLAHALGLSESRTSHLVKASLGTPFQVLLTRERITRARSMLISTDYSVKEIAQHVGMPNEYYFNRTFRKHTGQPPGRFRLNPVAG